MNATQETTNSKTSQDGDSERAFGLIGPDTRCVTLCAQNLRAIGNDQRRTDGSLHRGNRTPSATESSFPNSPYVISWIQQDLGLTRESQEDSAMVLHLQAVVRGELAGLTVGVVADGCGGHVSGEVASKLCCEALTTSIYSEICSLRSDAKQIALPTTIDAVLEKAFEGANDAIFRSVAADNQLEGMATTAVCLALLGTDVHFGWVGDSRAYLYREGTLTQLTRDHNRVQVLVDQKIITPADARLHPARNHLTKALGMSLDVVPDIVREKVLPGDLYVLSTDGFHEGLSPEDISRVCAAYLDNSVTSLTLQSLAATLAAQSIEDYGGDNLTAVFVYVEPPCTPSLFTHSASKPEAALSP
jgi:PPM family protein phosphatase